MKTLLNEDHMIGNIKETKLAEFWKVRAELFAHPLCKEVTISAFGYQDISVVMPNDKGFKTVKYRGLLNAYEVLLSSLKSVVVKNVST